MPLPAQFWSNGPETECISRAWWNAAFVTRGMHSSLNQRASVLVPPTFADLWCIVWPISALRELLDMTSHTSLSGSVRFRGAAFCYWLAHPIFVSPLRPIAWHAIAIQWHFFVPSTMHHMIRERPPYFWKVLILAAFPLASTHLLYLTCEALFGQFLQGTIGCQEPNAPRHLLRLSQTGAWWHGATAPLAETPHPLQLIWQKELQPFTLILRIVVLWPRSRTEAWCIGVTSRAILVQVPIPLQVIWLVELTLSFSLVAQLLPRRQMVACLLGAGTTWVPIPARSISIALPRPPRRPQPQFKIFRTFGTAERRLFHFFSTLTKTNAFA